MHDRGLGGGLSGVSSDTTQGKTNVLTHHAAVKESGRPIFLQRTRDNFQKSKVIEDGHQLRARMYKVPEHASML